MFSIGLKNMTANTSDVEQLVKNAQFKLYTLKNDYQYRFFTIKIKVDNQEEIFTFNSALFVKPLNAPMTRYELFQSIKSKLIFYQSELRRNKFFMYNLSDNTLKFSFKQRNISEWLNITSKRELTDRELLKIFNKYFEQIQASYMRAWHEQQGRIWCNSLEKIINLSDKLQDKNLNIRCMFIKTNQKEKSDFQPNLFYNYFERRFGRCFFYVLSECCDNMQNKLSTMIIHMKNVC